MMQMALSGSCTRPISKPRSADRAHFNSAGKAGQSACHVLAVAGSSSSAMGAERVQDDRVYVPSPG